MQYFEIIYRSSRSRSRSRSSTPEGIPRRGNNAESRRSESPVNRNTAPLQKRLMNLASSSTGSIIKNIKKEPEDKNKDKFSAADAALRGNRRRSSSNRSRSSSGSSRSSSGSSRSRSKSPGDKTKKRSRQVSGLKPAVPPEEPLNKEPADPISGLDEATSGTESEAVQAPKQQIRMTLKTSNTVSKTVRENVLEKLGDTNEILENAKAKRDENRLKKASEIKKEKKEKKEKKSAADRREELLKQLKAVENAIAKKRTKISQESKR